MKCEFCGRELEPDELICECGHSAAEKNEDKEKTEKAKKPAKSDKRKDALIFLIMAAAVGIIAFIVYKVIIGRDIRSEDSWETVKKDGYSITIPSVMKESSDVSEMDSDYTKLGFFKCADACVYISKADFNEDEKKIIKQRGVDGLRNWMLENAAEQSINGYKLSPVQSGELIIVEYPVNQEDYVKDTDELWTVSATLLTDDCVYQIDAYCARSESEKYESSMVKWLESFRLE